MVCYIKDKKTFKTKSLCTVSDYELTILSIYDEVSTLKVILKKEVQINDGDIIYFGAQRPFGYFGVIKESSVEKLVASLKCEYIVKLFARDLIYTGSPSNGPELYIKAGIDNNYTNQSDTVYRMPFLSVKTNSITTSAMNPDVEDGVWNIKSYIAKSRRLYNIFTDFAISKDTLLTTIERMPINVKQIDLSNPLIKVLEESYSNKSVGKVTTICEENNQAVSWYLLDDGTITRNYQATNRVDGEWVTITVSKEEDVEFSAQDEFAKSTYSHKILFSVTQENARYRFFDRVKIASHGRIFHSYISAIRVKNKDPRIQYQCGELRTSFIDKIQEEL